MDEKYVLTDETIIISGHILHRIRAVKDFGQVKAGDLGGYIESTENLDQRYECWVAEGACVFSDAMVFDNVKIFGDAKVYDHAMIGDDVKIFGDVEIYGHSSISDNVEIYGPAKIYGFTTISGNVKIFNNVEIYGSAKISGDVNISGVKIGDDAMIHGSTIPSNYFWLFIDKQKKS